MPSSTSCSRASLFGTLFFCRCNCFISVGLYLSVLLLLNTHDKTIMFPLPRHSFGLKHSKQWECDVYLKYAVGLLLPQQYSESIGTISFSLCLFSSRWIFARAHTNNQCIPLRLRCRSHKQRNLTVPKIN